MSRRARLGAFVVAAAAVGALLVLAFVGLPDFGSAYHPYRDRAVRAAVSHATANVVSSVTYDQRALDTLAEETILVGAALGTAALLRPTKEERKQATEGGGRVLESTKLVGYLLLPLTLLLGVDVVVHGHLTPGGGFQGGIIVATGVHLLYVAGRIQALERLRPTTLFELGEAVGAGAYALLGVAGLAAAGAFLTNIVPYGTFGQLLSAGTVPIINVAVGIAVAASVVVLLAKFLDQALRIAPGRDGGGGDS